MTTLKIIKNFRRIDKVYKATKKTNGKKRIEEVTDILVAHLIPNIYKDLKYKS